MAVPKASSGKYNNFMSVTSEILVDKMLVEVMKGNSLIHTHLSSAPRSEEYVILHALFNRDLEYSLRVAGEIQTM